MPDHSFTEDIFLNIQPESPLPQLEAVPSSPISSYVEEEADVHLATASSQVALQCNKVSPEPPLLQTEQSQLPQPLLVKACAPDPSPASLPFSGRSTMPQCLSCSERPETEHSTQGTASPVLSTGGQLLPCSCWPHSISNAGQDALALALLATLLAHVQLSIDQCSQVWGCIIILLGII